MSHTCHLPGCNTACPQRMLFCRKHWSMVPRALQLRVYTTVDDRGPNVDATWAPWWRAQAAATANVLRKLNRPNVEAWLEKELETARKLEAMAERQPTTLEVWHSQGATEVSHESQTVQAMGDFMATTVSQILEAVVDRFKADRVTVGALLGGRRQRRIAKARAVAMYLARELTGMTYPELGAAFGGRHHTTIIAAVQKTRTQLTTDESLRLDVEAIREQLKPVWKRIAEQAEALNG